MTTPKPKKCLQCNKVLLTHKFKPFCSLRCKNIDLHKWLSNQYSISACANTLDANEIEDENTEDDFN